MASLADVETEEPDFAARVRASFDAHVHKILATLRADGSPRVSGIEARFLDGELWMSGMPRSAKFEDLRRDARMALHSGSDEPDAFRADGKVSGRAVAVTDPTTRAAFARFAAVPEELAGFELFRVDLAPDVHQTRELGRVLTVLPRVGMRLCQSRRRLLVNSPPRGLQ